ILQPILSSSLRLILYTNSSCTSSRVGNLHVTPSPASPGRGSQSLSSSALSPCAANLSSASLSFLVSCFNNDPSSSSSPYPKYAASTFFLAMSCPAILFSSSSSPPLTCLLAALSNISLTPGNSFARPKYRYPFPPPGTSLPSTSNTVPPPLI